MKKASIDISLTQVIGLVLGVMVIVGSSYVALKFLGVIGIDENDEQSITFRDNLVRNMELLKQSKKNACWMTGSLDSDDGLFLFDGTAETINQQCDGDEAVERPGSCGRASDVSRGCICLCDVGYYGADDNDCTDSGYCTRVSSFTNFLYPSHENENIDDWWAHEGIMGGVYVSAHIYGDDCGGNVWAGGQQYYILEKSSYFDEHTLIISRVPVVEKKIDIGTYKYKSFGVVPSCTSFNTEVRRIKAK